MNAIDGKLVAEAIDDAEEIADLLDGLIEKVATETSC